LCGGEFDRYLVTTNNLFAFVDHTSEAELVRKRIKDGDDAGAAVTQRPSRHPRSFVTALARAVIAEGAGRIASFAWVRK